MIFEEKQFEARQENMATILGWVEEESMEHLPMAAALKMQLAAEEAIVNVVSYAYAEQNGAEPRPMQLTLGQDEDCYLEIKDWGKPFNPLEGIHVDPTQPLEERHLGGWGRALIVRTTSHVSYRYEQANILRLEEKAEGEMEFPDIPELPEE